MKIRHLHIQFFPYTLQLKSLKKRKKNTKSIKLCILPSYANEYFQTPSQVFYIMIIIERGTGRAVYPPFVDFLANEDD